MPQPSPALVERARRLFLATHSIYSHVRNLNADLNKEGFKFPDLLEHVLRDLEQDLDNLQILLNIENYPGRIQPADADNQSRRSDNPSSGGTEAPT